MDKISSISLPARNLGKEINIKLYKGIIMENEENVYKERYLVFDLIEKMYIKCFYLYQTNEYTNKVSLAQEFRTELDAITECKEFELGCFRIDKIYILDY